MPRPRALLYVCFLLVGLVPMAAAAQNQDTLYDVELIVFENVDAPGGTAGERWPDEPDQPDLSRARGLLPARGGTRAYARLPASRHRLDSAWKKLQESKNYRPFLHVAWIQPGQGREDPRPVHIRDTTRVRPPAGQAVPGESGYLYRLDGTVTVSLGRYLHLETDLLYAEVVDPEAAPPGGNGPGQTPGREAGAAIDPWWPTLGPELRLYRMQQSRRMRSGELHYLDHPRFGIVALITPR